MKAYYEALPRYKKILGLTKSNWDLRVFYSRVVHDANYFAVPYEMVVPFIHILQYQATYGVTEAYEKEFNLKFTVEPEVELEVAGQDDQSYKWDWSMPNVVSCIKNAIADCEKLGVLEGKPDDVLDTVLQPWRSKTMQKVLQDEYPLLGVRNLSAQISSAVRKEQEEITA
jgi:hypothetical protein